MTTDVLMPRRVSYVKVGFAILLGLGMIGGVWYAYTVATAQPLSHGTSPQMQTPASLPSRQSGLSLEKVDYDAEAKREAAKRVAPGERNGTPLVDPSYVDMLAEKVADLEGKLAAKVAQAVNPTPSGPRTPATPDPSIVIRRKALAESRRAPLVVVNTGAKAPDGEAEARMLQPGWKIPFLVESAVHSDVGGEFIARVSETVYASSPPYVPLIDAGATVMGSTRSVQLIPGNERLPMVGVTLSIPGRKPIDLGSMPMSDREGQLGMVDDLDRHYGRLIGGIFVRGVLTGSTRVVQSETRTLGGVGAIPEGITQGAQQAVGPQLQRLYDVRPTIRVFRGSPGYIIVTKPLHIPAEG